MLFEFRTYDEVMARHQWYREMAARAALVQKARKAQPRAAIGSALAAFWQWLVGHEGPAPARVAAKKG